jgi:bifunctional non-homologous end joining protein LigD
MKPVLVAALPAGSDWIYEVKWDGYRAMLIKHRESAQLLSRNNNSLAEDFPGIVESAKELSAQPQKRTSP